VAAADRDTSKHKPRRFNAKPPPFLPFLMNAEAVPAVRRSRLVLTGLHAPAGL
jgi:hypothetical protein